MYKINYKYDNFIIRIELSNIFNLNELEPLIIELSQNLDNKYVYSLVDARNVIYTFGTRDLITIKGLTDRYLEKLNINVYTALLTIPDTEVTYFPFVDFRSLKLLNW